MESITELKNEHSGVKTMLGIIEAILTRSANGREVNVDDLNEILEFLTVFVDRCHHGKEEDFLFPALESAGLSRDQSHIGELLQEHEQGRQLVAGLRDVANNFKIADQTVAGKLEKAGREYVALLKEHIQKEENVLFPMAEDMLGEEKDAELAEAFEKVERERVGPGKHEEFHELLHRLEQTYTG